MAAGNVNARQMVNKKPASAASKIAKGAVGGAKRGAVAGPMGAAAGAGIGAGAKIATSRGAKSFVKGAVKGATSGAKRGAVAGPTGALIGANVGAAAGVAKSRGAKNVVKGAAKGAASGAKRGAVAGPMGAAMGAGLGAGLGAIGGLFKKGGGGSRVDKKPNLPKSQGPKGGSGKYVVKKGDTLTSIAKANNTTVAALRKSNPKFMKNAKYDKGNKIWSGTTVRLGK